MLRRLNALADSRLGRNLSVRFILVGCINTAFSYLMYAAFLALGLTVAVASLLALMIGILFSFYTQGTLVFGDRSRGAFVRFVAVWAAIYFFNLGAIRLFMSLGLSAYLAGAVATVPTTILSYIIQRRIVFRPRRCVAGDIS